MKIIIVFFFLCIVMKVHIYAQANPYVNDKGVKKEAVTRTIESFGAKANDEIDDSYAFYKAARYFSNLDTTKTDTTSHNYINYNSKYGVLNLGKGEYIVGDQKTNNSSSKKIYNHDEPKYQPLFNNLNGLIIQGQAIGSDGKYPSKVKIRPGGYFGYFKRSLEREIHQPLYGAVADNKVNLESCPTSTGTVFLLGAAAKNVLIQNIQLDGSSNTYNIGAAWVLHGDLNSASHGVASYGGQFLSLKNLYIHNFGEDGLYLESSVLIAPKGSWNVVIDNIQSLWNGRQALSWVHGRDVKIENSTFAYTCLEEGNVDTDPNPKLSRVAGSPGCNVDIEPGYPESKIRNGLFNNCKIIGNVSASPSLAVQLDSDSIIFNNCEIKAANNSNAQLLNSWEAIGFEHIHNRNIMFFKCDIIGSINFQKYLEAKLPDNGLTTFNGCSIASNLCNSYLGDHALIDTYDRCLFNNCTITQRNQRPIFFGRNVSLNEHTIPNPDNYTTLNNCTIVSTFSSDAKANDLRGRMYGLRFTGNTKWSHKTTASAREGQSIFFQNVTINGSKTNSAANTFTFPNLNTFEGNYYDYLVAPSFDKNNVNRPIIIGETPFEYLNVYIGEGSNGFAVLRNEARPLYIGEGVTITVRKGSALILSGDIYLAGKLIVESGAYLKYTAAVSGSKYGRPGPPTIHLLGSNNVATINKHIVLQQGASISSENIPFIWTSDKFEQPLYAMHLSRSELMAPDEYLRTEVKSNRSNYNKEKK